MAGSKAASARIILTRYTLGRGRPTAADQEDVTGQVEGRRVGDGYCGAVGLEISMWKFEIIPLIGAKPLTFQMDSQAVRTILGPPGRSWKDFRGKLVENWEGVAVSYSTEDGKLDEIVISPPAVATIDGVNAFDFTASISKLRQVDGKPLRWNGSVVFLDAAVALRGALDPHDQIAVAVDRKNHWEQHRSRMAPL